MTDRPAAQPTDPSRRGTGRGALALGVLVLCALAVRLVYYFQFSDNPWFQYPITDERIYDRIARNLVAGKPGWKDVFYHPPGYPLFLTLLYAGTERALGAVRLIQMLLGVVNVALLYWIGLRVFGPVLGFVSALLFAFYAPMFFFEGMMLPPVLVVFLDLAFFLALLRCVEKPRWWRGLATGALLGASAATMSIVLPFAAVVVALGGRHLFLAAAGDPERGRRLAAVGCAFLLGVGTMVGACTLHNWIVAEKLVVISNNTGINLYLGSGANFERKVAIRPGKEWTKLTTAPIRAGRKDDPSGYYVDRSLKIIRSDPAAYAESLVRKLFLFAHGHELKRNQDPYPFRRYSSVLAALLWKAGIAWPFGILFPFAVLGMIHSLREKSFGANMMSLFCVSHILLLLPFFMSARYRMNIVPFLILFGVYGGSVLLRSVREGRWRSTGACALVLAVFLTISNWRVGEMSKHLDVDHYHTLAAELQHEGRTDAAQVVLRHAKEATPAPAPSDSIPWRTSTLLVGAGALTLLGSRKLTGSSR